MLFDVEIVLRARNYAVTERVETSASPDDWTDLDVEQLLKSILLAIDHVNNPDALERFVVLRGFSWIVEPVAGGVVIAIEIPTGAAVAGPFPIAQQRLDSMITRVLASAAPSRPVVH